MFANRFTILVDACSLADALKRNLLLSLAEADFFRVRWSARILDETEQAIAKIRGERGHVDATDQASRARKAMECAFGDAAVTGYEPLMAGLTSLPDLNDAHVIAAAIMTRASIIVTENVKHFPDGILQPLNLEAKTADAFISDAIDLEAGRAIAAVRRMRERFKKPERTAEAVQLDMEARGLTATADILREHVLSI